MSKINDVSNAVFPAGIAVNYNIRRFVDFRRKNIWAQNGVLLHGL